MKGLTLMVNSIHNGKCFEYLGVDQWPLLTRRAINSPIDGRYRAPVPLIRQVITSRTLPPARKPKRGRQAVMAGPLGPRHEQEALMMKRNFRVLAAAGILLLS